jgi:hypothetical protein
MDIFIELADNEPSGCSTVVIKEFLSPHQEIRPCQNQCRLVQYSWRLCDLLAFRSYGQVNIFLE